MVLLQHLGNSFKTSDLDRQIINEEVRKNNTKRALYILVGSVAIHIFLIILFIVNNGPGTDTELSWRSSIITLHTVLLAINGMLAALALYINYSGRDFKRTSKVLFTAVFIMLPVWGAIAVALDQWVTPSIISFFLVCAVCSIGLLLRPILSFLFFAFAYLVFYTGISYTQHNPEILLTNKVNGFCAVAICYGVSVLFWHNSLIRYRQSRLIELQKQELEENYNKLLQSTQQLTDANATKDKFFSIIAHDLRGPITATTSLTEMLIDGSQISSKDEYDQMMRMLHDSLSNTSKLLSNLLLWARAQTSDIGLQQVNIQLRQHIQANIELLHSQASEKNIIITNNINEHAAVFADAEMLSTIMRNLISNAIKFTNTGGNVCISAEMLEHQQIKICVKDDGIGLSPAKIEDLFRTDKRTSSIGTRKETGTGLGLILCKEFIEKHNGTIWAESEPGKGSCFIFTLPVAQAQA